MESLERRVSQHAASLKASFVNAKDSFSPQFSADVALQQLQQLPLQAADALAQRLVAIQKRIPLPHPIEAASSKLREIRAAQWHVQLPNPVEAAAGKLREIQEAQKRLNLPNPIEAASQKLKEVHEGVKTKQEEHTAAWRRHRVGRTVEFWARAGAIYASYKVCQAKAGLSKDKEEQQRIWEEQHEQAAQRLYGLCTDLGGFFLKGGQFFAKPDIAPLAWVRELSKLHDSVPADKFEVIRKAIETELGGRPVEEVFEWVEESPLGSASIAQVHKGKLKGSGKGECVAVKVQRRGVEPLMLMDLSNVRAFASFLQKHELPFDLISVVEELEDQFMHEFDFHLEAASMQRIGQSLRSGGKSRRALLAQKKARAEGSGTPHEDLSTKENGNSSPVIVPKVVPGLVTRHLLVMEFIDGVQIMRMPEEIKKRGLDPSGPLARKAKGKILKDLMQAFGQMMLRDGEFQADPHPGNILVCSGPKVALLDYGQTKELSEQSRTALAHLILAAASRDPVQIGRAFKVAGIETAKTPEEDPHSFLRMGVIMWDTKCSPGLTSSNPFSEESTLKSNSLNKFPKDLFFALKVMQFLRGLSMGMDINVSAAEMWKPLAQEVIRTSQPASQ